MSECGEYERLLRLAEKNGWRTPRSEYEENLPLVTWINYWQQCIEYEIDRAAGRPVIPHRSGGGEKT